MIKEIDNLKEVETQEVVAEEVVEPTPEELPPQSKAKKAKKEEPVTKLIKLVTGQVVRISKLRVRKAASTKSDILEELSMKDFIHIDLEGSTDNFYRIFLDPKTQKREGFVVKEFVELLG